MDPDLILIFGFVLVVVLVVTRGVTRIVTRALAHKERMRLGHIGHGVASSEDYRKLEERVRVLERIATDKSDNADLARQIEQLRDLQELDTLPRQQEAAR